MCAKILLHRLNVSVYQAEDLKDKRKKLEDEEGEVGGHAEVRHMH